MSATSATTLPSLSITRTIHPVGQGAFYSEFFSDVHDKQPLFTTVYDCGANVNNKDALDGQINDFDHPVDLLFISHFHQDHINGVCSLLNKNDRECLVIIPGVNHCRFIVDLISNYICSAAVGSPAISFMLSCIPALKSKCMSSGPLTIFKGQNPGISCKLPGGIVPYKVLTVCTSATPLTIDTPLYTWHYDADYTEINRIKEESLIKNLSDIIPSLKDILDDIYEYRDPEWYEQILLAELTSDKIEDIEKAYTNVFGKRHNSYSMIVHSYPDPSIKKNNIDCLYTGDINIGTDDNLDNLKKKLCGCHPRYIQVPHHGSRNNHNPGLYFKHQIAFISVGKSNTYGHPASKVLMDLIQKCSDIHIVTECKKSKYKRSFML